VIPHQNLFDYLQGRQFTLRWNFRSSALRNIFTISKLANTTCGASMWNQEKSALKEGLCGTLFWYLQYRLTLLY